MLIGIIGGGQLGMMMAQSAIKIGHEIISLDPNPNCSITMYSKDHIAKDYNDKEALAYMNKVCDVLTYEFENVDLGELSKYIDKLPQGIKALEISRDRVIEKVFAKSLGIEIPKFNIVQSINDVFIPSIIKTTTGGYDGKGQYRITKREEIDHIENIGKVKYICEELIEFDYEISVIATRDKLGSVVFLPIPINKHKSGILHTSTITNDIPSTIQEKAYEYTTKIIQELDYVGTLAVEYFVKGSKVIFNEFAPRPHNSGHYSIEGCNVSQYENHVRAITGEPVIKPRLVKQVIVINVLGQHKDVYKLYEDTKDVYVHDYNKNSDKENRKIGHITYIADTKNQLDTFREDIIRRFNDE